MSQSRLQNFKSIPDSELSPYYKTHRHSPTHELTKHAAAIVIAVTPPDKPLNALDIGCGTGRDTEYLLNNGFLVTATDKDPIAIGLTIERCKANKALNTQVATFQDLKLTQSYQLISSNLTLSFEKPSLFNKLWALITQHTDINYFFSGQFFGEHHAWNTNKEMTFFDKKSLISLFNSIYHIISIAETDKTAKTVSNGQVRWHQWDVIAQRRAIQPEKPLFLASCRLFARANELAKQHHLIENTKPKVVNRITKLRAK